MRTLIGNLSRDIDAKDLDLLADMLIRWCRERQTDPNELTAKLDLILERFREGEREPNKLFGNI